MTDNSVLSNIQSEFKLWGIKPTISHSGGGHIELTWQASPDKPERSTFIPKSGSDWRGWLNQRAQVRRMLKADGLNCKEQIKKEKEKPAIVKALAAPELVESKDDQLKMLRAEVADLSELTMSMMTMLKELIAVTPPPQSMVVELPQFVPVAPKKPSVRSIKAILFVSENWSSNDAIARDMGLEPTIAYRKLYYLLQQDKVELSQGRWRRKPKEQGPPKAVPPSKRKLNGNSRGLHA